MIDLTPREREIALLAGNGYTNRQIADRLSISPQTVKNELYAAMWKIPETRHIRRREMLAVWLYRHETGESGKT